MAGQAVAALARDQRARMARTARRRRWAGVIALAEASPPRRPQRAKNTFVHFVLLSLHSFITVPLYHTP